MRTGAVSPAVLLARGRGSASQFRGSDRGPSQVPDRPSLSLVLPRMRGGVRASSHEGTASVRTPPGLQPRRRGPHRPSEGLLPPRPSPRPPPTQASSRSRSHERTELESVHPSAFWTRQKLRKPSGDVLSAHPQGDGREPGNPGGQRPEGS